MWADQATSLPKRISYVSSSREIYRMMYFSRNAVFGKVSLRSEVCKHIGNSLHGAATLFLFTVQKTFFLNPAFIIQELSLRLFFFSFLKAELA